MSQKLRNWNNILQPKMSRHCFAFHEHFRIRFLYFLKLFASIYNLNSFLFSETKSEDSAKSSDAVSSSSKCSDADVIPLQSYKTSNGEMAYNMSFVIYISDVKHEGLYSLYFHNCHNYNYDRDGRNKVIDDLSQFIEIYAEFVDELVISKTCTEARLSKESK